MIIKHFFINLKQFQTDSQEESSYTNDNETDKLNAFLILFSSGTTRQAKPVQITHQTVIANLQRLRSQIFNPPTSSDKFLLSLCMSTVYGFYSAYHALINGAELFMARKHVNKAFVKSLEEFKVL